MKKVTVPSIMKNLMFYVFLFTKKIHFVTGTEFDNFKYNNTVNIYRILMGIV